MIATATEAVTRTGGVLAATCISTLLVNANTSSASILLPAISEDTGTSVTTLQWAVTATVTLKLPSSATAGRVGPSTTDRRAR